MNATSHTSPISAEARFITNCLHDKNSAHRDDTVRLARAVSDWERVIEASRFHGVASWVMRCIEKSPDAVPPNVSGAIKAAAFADIAKVSRLRLAMHDILGAIHKRELNVIVLKGAALVSLLYGDATLRPMEDIDLLCDEDDFPTIRDIIISLGFEYDEGDAVRESCLPIETRFEHHFYHPDGLVTIELHVDSLKLGVRPKHSAMIWNRARPIEVENVPTLTLSLEDQVVMLSVHLHRHGFNRLIWFKDIDLLIRRFGGEIDWNLVISEAKREGAESSIWYTFAMLEKLLNTPVPERVKSQLKPGVMKRWAYSRIWPEASILDLNAQTKRRAVQFDVSEPLRGILPSLILMNRRREKLGILMRRFLPIRTTAR